MTLQQVNLRDRQSGRLVAGYAYDRLNDTFALVLAAETQPALTLVTDLGTPVAQRLRLFQALLRHPRADSDLLPYAETAIAYEVVSRRCELVAVAVNEAAEAQPNITVAVGGAHVDNDAFGAECQLDMTDNRLVATDSEIAGRTFYVLDARLAVDAQTGQRYPTITTEGGPCPLFWALPAEYSNWVTDPATHNLFPCLCVFDHDDDGQARVDTYIRMER